MNVIHRIADLPHPAATHGFVPTMGALHAGHLALLERSVSENQYTTLSIFVNPTQFGPSEDFDRYPRTLEADLEMAAKAGVSTVFVPTVEEVYPHREVSVNVGGVSERWEGSMRPGHFNGVATVVTKLFGMVRPDVAYFGQKDLQQCQVIRLITEGLNLGVKLTICPTIREADGLAMSSRNRYLNAEERPLASMIYRLLSESAQAIQSGKSPNVVTNESRRALTDAGFAVDYFAFVDLPDMNEREHFVENSALIVAAKLGKPRLIDNVVFIASQEKA